MADDTTTSAGAGATPVSDPQPATGNASTSGATSQAKPGVTLEEALAHKEELERSLKNAKEELERHRKNAKKLAEYEQHEKESQEAQLSEIERTKKQFAELQAQHSAYTQQMQERLVRYEVEKQAAKLNIIDPEAAATLLPWSELEYNEDGTPKNAVKLLEALLKNKPYLAPAKPDESQQQAQQAPAQTANQLQAPAIPAGNPSRAGRTDWAHPGTPAPGRVPQWSEVFKRP